MADAPRSILAWLGGPHQGLSFAGGLSGEEIEYIRADIARADAELAVAQVVEKAAWTAYRICAETRHVKLGSQAEEAIRVLAPAEALAEVQRLRARVTSLSEQVDTIAEQRDAALARVEKLRHQITEASDPDFIWGALDNVHDAETTLDDYAAAVSRAIRAALDEDAK